MDEAINLAIVDVIDAFLDNPTQFHGDAGITPYLFHRLLSQPGDHFYLNSPDLGTPTLLLQSEHRTSTKWSNTGREPRAGRIDLVICDREAVPNTGRINHCGDAIRGFEVGRNKKLDSMGNLFASRDDQNAAPGDAAKLIREIRFGSIKVGYVIEFYDSTRRAPTARSVIDNVSRAVESIRGPIDLRVVVVLRGSEQDQKYVSTWPKTWELPRGEEWRSIDEVAQAIGVPNAREGFRQRCGNKARELLQALYATEVSIVPGTVSLQVRSEPGRPIFYVYSSDHANGERIDDLEEDILQSLRDRHIDVKNGQVTFSDNLDIGAVVDAVVQVLVNREAIEVEEGVAPRDRFLNECSPVLQDLLHRIHERDVWPRYGQRTMTVRRGIGDKICRVCQNYNDDGEQICELSPEFEQELRNRDVLNDQEDIVLVTNDLDVEAVVNSIDAVL